MFKYYKRFGVLYAYDADGSQDAYIPADAVTMTEAEIDAHLNPPLVPEQYVDLCRRAVQQHIDATAATRLYDSGNSLASYIASTNPVWAAEAQAFVAWRDAVWVAVYALWAEPPEPWPTPQELVGSLPVIEWP